MTKNLKDIPFALGAIDAEGVLKDWNGAFLVLLGLSEKDAKGAILDDLLLIDGSVGTIAATAKSCAEALSEKSYQVVSRADMSKKFDLRLVGSRGKDKYCHVQLVAHDSQAANSEQKGDGASPQASGKADFLAAVNHKLRTPVSGLLAVAELLAETELTREQEQYVELLSASGEELTALTANIQQIAHLEAGDVKPNIVAANIGALMRDCIVAYGEAAAQKHLNIQLTQADDMPERVMVDRDCLKQVLDILIGNAIKYTAAGHVTLMASFADDKLVMRVEDTGIGIDADALLGLAQDGSDNGTAAQKKYSTSGFGLFLVYQLVELLGGKVDVKSDLGRGSSFTISVPATVANGKDIATEKTQGLDDPADILSDAELSELIESAKSPVKKPPKAASTPKLRKLNILVAEDNPVNQTLFKKLLEREGHEVAVVGDGQQAVSLLQLGQSFDLILMDISMPVMDGLDATVMIRSLYGPVGQTPILALTAHAMDGDRERFLNVGMNGYQSKPVNPEALMEAIAEVVGSDSAFVGDVAEEPAQENLKPTTH